jgi:hypothetical protein
MPSITGKNMQFLPLCTCVEVWLTLLQLYAMVLRQFSLCEKNTLKFYEKINEKERETPKLKELVHPVPNSARHTEINSGRRAN